MPQSLRFRPDTPIVVGYLRSSAIERRPALGLKAMQLIESWSVVESFLLRLFVRLMGGNDALATKVYLALDAKGAKARAIAGAAEATLREGSPELFEVLRAVQRIAAANQKSRDKVAHWIWAYSDELPDALLLIHPESLLPSGLDRSVVYAYTAKCFADAIAANQRLCDYAGLLLSALEERSHGRRSPWIEKLCSEPEIVEVLNRKVRTASVSQEPFAD